MSGRRFHSTLMFSLMAVVSCGCQSDGSRRMWNPFAKADATAETGVVAERIALPKFARRKSENDDKPEQAVPLLASANVDALLNEGEAALAEHRLEDAAQAYETILASVPDNATAHHGLAMAADLSQNWADAEYHYKQALRIRPRDANLLCDIGYSYVLQDRYSEASRYLNQAIEINPQHDSAHMNLALLDLKQGDRASAEQRVMQRFGTTATATQALARLEASLVRTAPVIQQTASTRPMPSDASLQDVRELADRERRRAEQERIMRMTNPGTDVVAPGITANPADAAVGNVSQVPAATGNNQPLASGQSAMQYPPAWSHAPVNGVEPQMSHHATVQPSTVQLPVTSMTQPGVMPPATSSATSPIPNGVVPIHATGAFQNSGQPGSSYGQVVGFGTAQTPNGSNAMMNTMSASWPGATALPQQMPPSSNPASTNATSIGNSAMPLDGLNVGPGSLFPFANQGSAPTAMPGNAANNPGFPANASQPYQTPAAIGQPGWPGVGNQPGLSPASAPPNLQMSNIASPGSNSMLNGAMYSQPVSTLPSYDWALQQQAVQQSVNGNVPSAVNALPSGQRPAMANPLEVYERERQRLDAQYYNTLKSVNQQPAGPQHSGLAPTARY